MPQRNKDGLFEFQNTLWEYTWVFNGERKYANWSNTRGLIIGKEF